MQASVPSLLVGVFDCWQQVLCATRHPVLPPATEFSRHINPTFSLPADQGATVRKVVLHVLRVLQGLLPPPTTFQELTAAHCLEPLFLGVSCQMVTPARIDLEVLCACAPALCLPSSSLPLVHVMELRFSNENKFSNNNLFIGKHSFQRKDFPRKKIFQQKDFPRKKFFQQKDFPKQSSFKQQKSSKKKVLSNKKIFQEKSSFQQKKSSKKKFFPTKKFSKRKVLSKNKNLPREKFFPKTKIFQEKSSFQQKKSSKKKFFPTKRFSKRKVLSKNKNLPREKFFPKTKIFQEKSSFQQKKSSKKKFFPTKNSSKKKVCSAEIFQQSFPTKSWGKLHGLLENFEKSWKDVLLEEVAWAIAGRQRSLTVYPSQLAGSSTLQCL